MTVEKNKDIVRTFIQKFWNEGTFKCVDQYLSEDYYDHAYEPNDVEGLLKMANLLQAAFPNQSSTLESIVGQDDRVIVRLRMTGTHTGNFRGTDATHNQVDVRLYREYRLRDGKIVEHWALFDTAQLLRQIGAELNQQPACQIKR